MNLSIQDLPANVIASYEATAHSRGITLEVFLREYLIKNAPPTPPVLLNEAEWEKAVDECFDAFPVSGPLPDSAFDRENIYERENEW